RLGILKRYINQLTYAKAQCERRISILKNPSFSVNNKTTSGIITVNSTLGVKDASSSAAGEGADAVEIEGSETTTKISTSLQNLPGRKILMFQVLLESAFARRYFSIYLDEIGKGALLSFWSAVQELKQADKRHHYQLGMEIYHTYLAPQSAPIKVDKVFIRGVEAFLLGNRGPEVLYEIMEEVERTLEDRHYTGFLVSSTYHAMLKQAQLQGIDFMSSGDGEGGVDKTAEGTGGGILDSEGVGGVDNVSLHLTDHSTYARNKLAYLQERLNNKLLALQAIQQTKKADPKVILHLEGEIATIRRDHRQLECHVERTALWSEHLGHWRVYVHNVQVTQEKEVPSLTLFVHLISDESKVYSADFLKSLTEVVSGGEPFTTPTLPIDGWVVVQKITQLTEMHRKLCQIIPWIKSLELPSGQTKLLFTKQLDRQHLMRVRTVTQDYFNAIMKDDKLQGSELLYAFLSPSPEYLKQIMGPTKKSRFSLSTLFKSGEGKSECEEEDMGNLIMGENAAVVEGTVEGSDGTKDSINSFWPEEELKPPPPAERTPQEMIMTRNEAQEMFVKNLPELLCTLVGQQNARKGAERLFCTLQHHALNKNLIYTAFEVVLKEIFPELQDKLKKL
ncbi:Sorting nexin-25, partial [Armadillidium nasatum]